MILSLFIPLTYRQLFRPGSAVCQSFTPYVLQRKKKYIIHVGVFEMQSSTVFSLAYGYK